MTNMAIIRQLSRLTCSSKSYCLRITFDGIQNMTQCEIITKQYETAVFTSIKCIQKKEMLFAQDFSKGDVLFAAFPSHFLFVCEV